MDKAHKILNDIYWVGVNDRETDIFEALWPVPQGVSYNSYLINDNKIALVDTVRNNYQDSFFNKIQSVIGQDKIDYLIINHMEPDHSGSLKSLVDRYPDIEIIGNEKTMNFLEGFYNISDNNRIIEDGEILDLGHNQLQFFITPMLHWPETMMTYEKNNKFLFSGDAFGSFGSLDGGILDKNLNLEDYENEIRRYYSNIVGKFSPIVQNTLSKLDNLEVNIIGATHGPIWKENPGYIIDKYDKMSSFAKENGVVIVYGSMYGNTKKIAEMIAEKLVKNNIKNIKIHDIARTHISYIISEIWKYKGLILGSCTYNNELFPPMKELIDALNSRKIKNNLVGVFGSYSWSGGAVSQLQNFCNNNNLDLVEPIIKSKFAPDNEVRNKCEKLGGNFAVDMK